MSNDLTTLDTQTSNETALALAEQLGYEGGLSVGTLEDGIRLYQRQTVEAILEAGKRLLLLKEITPHGEFYSRVEFLGLSSRTAQRFMQAAAKTSKSAIVADLSTRTKNARAFLELVTHDDDVLEVLTGLDDVDCMSASQLRERLRDKEKQERAVGKNLDAVEETNRALRKQVSELSKPYKITHAEGKPDALVEMQIDALALTEKINLCMDGLQEMVATLKTDSLSTVWASVAQGQLTASVAHVLQQAAGLYTLAQSQGLFDETAAEHSALLPLKDDGLEVWQERYSRITTAYADEKHNRRVALNELKPAGKGRPMKPRAVVDDAVIAKTV